MWLFIKQIQHNLWKKQIMTDSLSVILQKYVFK